MKIVEKLMLAILGIAGLAALHQVVALVFSAHDWKGPTPQDWAAWVQAVGSIAAIAAAIWIGEKASRRALQQAREMDQLALSRKYDSVRAILDDADLQCREIAEEFRMTWKFNTFSFGASYSPLSFKAVIDAIEQIPLHELGSYDCVQGIAALRNSMISLKEKVEEIRAHDFEGEPRPIASYFWEAHGTRFSGRARAAYESAVQAIGGSPSQVPARAYANMIEEMARVTEKLREL